ncbi:hypothetical protein [Streptomyces sp. NPDC059209]|uniref:hypothetical protein n=1 Tax=Streptomyces sp. NPDC059209 TaxID=3346769 RepID=UPI0036930ACC
MAEARDEAVAFRDASNCKGRPGGDCIATVVGTVVAKESGPSCISIVEGRPVCRNTYKLKLRHGERREVVAVRQDAYGDVRRGDRVELRTWRGELASMTLHGDTRIYESDSWMPVAAGLGVGWLVLGVAVWAAVSGRLASLFVSTNVPWILPGLTFVLLGQTVLLGARVIEWVYSVVFAILGTVLGVFLWREGREQSRRS